MRTLYCFSDNHDGKKYSMNENSYSWLCCKAMNFITLHQLLKGVDEVKQEEE